VSPTSVRPSAPPTSASDPVLELARALGHEVKDPRPFWQALTHRSFTNERPDLAPDHNETLEFLGDSVVGLAAAMLLRETFPAAREGELTRRRADLVCEKTLARIAQDLEIGPSLRLGRGEERSGGRTKARLLASALEAAIAAVLLDSSVDTALDVDARAPGEDDFKSRVQEHLQAAGKGTPRYELVGHEGPEHARTFFVAIALEGRELARGQGRSKLEAEQAAARTALEQLTKPSGAEP
jgi:ribonuclease-3